MRVQATGAMVAVVIGMTMPAGCGGGGHRTSKGPFVSTRPVRTYTAEELKKALIVPPAGVGAVAETGTPDRLVANFGGGGMGRPDKPWCDRGTLARALARAPMANLSFAPGSRFAGESLTAADEATAGRIATAETPAACRSVTWRRKGMTETVRVLTDEPVDLGEGGRIKEMTDTANGESDRTWTVTFYGPGYLAEVGLSGGTRAQALAQAKAAYDKVRATLG